MVVAVTATQARSPSRVEGQSETDRDRARQDKTEVAVKPDRHGRCGMAQWDRKA